MKNVQMTVDGNKLIIVVDLKQTFGPSASGKSTVIASTEGNQSIPNQSDVKIGLNVYTKKV